MMTRTLTCFNDLPSSLTQYQKVLIQIITVGFFGFVFGYFFFPSHGFHTWFFDLLVLFPWLFLVPFYPQIVPYRERLFLLTTILIVYLWITVFWSTDLSLYSVWDFGRLVVYLLSLLSAVWLVTTHYPNSEDFLVRGLIIIGTTHAFVSLSFHFFAYGLQFAQLNPLGRMNNPIRGAHVYGAVTLVGIWSYMKASDRKSRVIDGLAVFLLLMATIYTKSRGPMLALVFTVPFIMLALRTQSGGGTKRFRYEWLILGAIIVFGTFLSGIGRWEALLERGFSERIEIWPYVLREAMDFPWFGQGIRADTHFVSDAGHIFGHSHNFLLSVLRFGGVIGLCLMLVQLGYCFLTAFRNGTPNSRLWGLLLIYGCLSLLTSGKYPLRKPTETWLIFWIPIAFLCVWDARKRKVGHGGMNQDSRLASHQFSLRDSTLQ